MACNLEVKACDHRDVLYTSNCTPCRHLMCLRCRQMDHGHLWETSHGVSICCALSKPVKMCNRESNRFNPEISEPQSAQSATALAPTAVKLLSSSDMILRLWF
eukprot:TRINITY_DN38423_c0_g1_i1.p1 TRINITY_DN38423_c0_g1~~TRINITY_DN38423_c0_g1_i1.p1  ORF type:complete len:103 (-),score=5.57 TRINITY_DN38423_c0_g1_i1:311-619(-)